MDGIVWIFILIAVFKFIGNAVSKSKQSAKDAENNARGTTQERPVQVPPARHPDWRSTVPGMPYTQRQAPLSGSTQPPSYGKKAYDPRFPDYEPQRKTNIQREQAAALQQARANERLRRQEGAEWEPEQERQAGVPITSTLQSYVPEATKGRRHELEASFITGHAHVEGGLEEDAAQYCPPAQTLIKTQPQKLHSDRPLAVQALQALTRDSDTLVHGVLMLEILGKPKALRAR